MTAAKPILCPVCHRPVDPVGAQHLPFCSSRCRTIDLGRWLNEAYGLPQASEEEEGDAFEELDDRAE